MRPRQPAVLGHCSWQLCPKRPSLQARKRAHGYRSLFWAPASGTYLALSPSKLQPHGLRVFPALGILSCRGPSSPSLPCSQRVPVNPGGHTHSPSWSWQTPPCRQPGHSLVQPGPQRPAPQPGGTRVQQLTRIHLTIAAEDWGSPGNPGDPRGPQEGPTGLPASHTTHHLCSLPLTPHDEPKEGAAQGAGFQVGGTVDAA